MCGRFTLTSSPETLAQRFELEATPQLAPRYNIAPGQQVLAVRVDAEVARRIAVSLRWGLVPSWAKDPSIGTRMINARSETVAGKAAFRSAFRSRRCLVPADGFYEWAQRGATKQAYHIGLRAPGPFAFAALWECWSARGGDDRDSSADAAGEALETCTLLTTAASECIREIHDRMPVILETSDYARWLDPELSNAEALQPLLRPLPDSALAFHPVSNRVNSVRFDDIACAAPAPESPRQDSLF
jgi:putative SOS response-associated peptidase YedK